MTVVERISRLALAAAGVVLAVALLVPSSAHAGQYHVYSCRTPSGQVAPTEGWSGAVVAQANDHHTRTENTCGVGGALTASLGDQVTHIGGTAAIWTFEPPSVERLVGATLARAGDTDGGTRESDTYEFMLAGSTEASHFDLCRNGLLCDSKGEFQSPLSPANQVVAPAASLGGSIFVRASCNGPTKPPLDECQDGFGDPNAYAAVVYLYAADLILEQTAGPAASDVGGALASAPTVSGTSDLAFSATDPGAGVYQAVFSVDGQVVQRTGLDENGGKCRDVGQTSDGLPAFLSPQPCERSLSTDVGFDTTAVSNGTHHLVVSVTDAAGNTTAMLDRTITVANPLAPGTPGPPNGANATSQATLAVSWKGSRRERITAGYGHAEAIVGRLTAQSGTPIAGAQVEVLATPDYAGARTKTMTGPVTGSDGRFSMRLPAGESSRTLRFVYRSHRGDALPAVTRTLTLGVRAGIALTVSPHSASVGRSIYFRGRLRGGPIPHDGKQLVLEARSPGGAWIEFDVVRTDSRGRYRASYRFKFPGPAAYQFRVRSEPESDYPFAAGSSTTVEVHER
jgi:hypothetical protein